MAREINTGDNYRDRLLKLIPSELLGTYMAVNAALISMDPSTMSTVLLCGANALMPHRYCR